MAMKFQEMIRKIEPYSFMTANGPYDATDALPINVSAFQSKERFQCRHIRAAQLGFFIHRVTYSRCFLDVRVSVRLKPQKLLLHSDDVFVDLFAIFDELFYSFGFRVLRILAA